MPGKSLLLLSMIVISLTLMSCRNKEDSIMLLLKEAKDTLTLDQDITDHLDLPDSFSYLGQTINIIWSSGSPTVIQDDGTVIRPAHDEGNVTVTMTATLSLEGRTIVVSIDVVVKALDPITVSVTFISDPGVTHAYIDTIELGQTVNEPEPPVKEGFVFEGWAISEESNSFFDFPNTPVTEELTLYAYWTPVTPMSHTVSFETYNGSEVYAIEVMDGNTLAKPLDPTLEDHTFEGWFSDHLLTQRFDFDITIITEDVTLYAKFSPCEIPLEGTPIRTPEEFYQMAINASDDLYHLAQDIDFADYIWTHVNVKFTKTLNGNNKTLSNLIIQGGDRSGIFSRVDGASIHDLNLVNINIIATGRAGILIGEVDGTNVSVERITIINSSVFGNSSNGVGGLIGYTKPGFEVLISHITITETTIINNTSAAGGLVGMTDAGIVTVEHFFLDGLDIQAANRSGGLWGELKNNASVSIAYGYINAEVIGAQYISAMIGRNQVSSGISLSNLLFTGTVTSTNKDFGHISGDQSVTTINHVYLVDASFIGTLNRQTLDSSFIFEAGVTDTTAWYQTNMPDIHNHPDWVHNGSLYMLRTSFAGTGDLQVRLVYGHGLDDVIYFLNEGTVFLSPQPKDIEGYALVGWFIDPLFQTAYTFDQPVNDNLTLYALYQALPLHQVMVDDQSFTIVHGYLLPEPNDPFTPGLVFIEWFKDDAPYDFTTPVTSSFDLISQWREAETYVITLMLDEAETYDTLSLFEYDTVNLPVPESSDMRFVGWYLDMTYDAKFNQSDLINDIILFARFVPMGSVVFEDHFDGFPQSFEESGWIEDKPGDFTLESPSTLHITEGSGESIFHQPLIDLGVGRYILVFDFIQGQGGASFTIELMSTSGRVLTVGANRQNRFTFRQPDGSETSVPYDLIHVFPGASHRAVVIFDTEIHIYKYYIIQNDNLLEITPSGGVGFVNDDDITTLRIRSVGHGGSPALEPYVDIDWLLIETTSETEVGKSLYDVEAPIDYEQVMDEIHASLEIPFADNVIGDLFLPNQMFGVTITWESLSPEVITASGVVTRDADEDREVTLVASYSKAGFSGTKEFLVIVCALSSVISIPDTDYDLTGFADGHVSIPVLSEGDPGYYVVYTALDLMTAINAENSTSGGTTAARVIEIRSDLDLGYNEVVSQYGILKNLNAHAAPSMHPILIETGVSKIYIQDRDGSSSKYHEGLMIYSKSGHTIRHASFNIKRSNNIIIRNLKFDELWEWDEKTKGDYDSNDWDYFTVDTVNGIWFDHIELGKAYDGLIDFKAGSSIENSVTNATISFMKLVFEPNDFLLAQFEYLEANRSQYNYYNQMRLAGMTMEEIMFLNSFQKKGFLLGGSELRTGNVFTLTIHNSYVKNLQDRFPRLRGGDVHLFNNLYDATDVYLERNRVRTLYPALFAKSEYNRQLTNQALVTTEQGAIMMEHSIIMGVTQVIKSNQVNSGHPLMTGKYLVTESLFVLDTYTFYGSSSDPDTPFVRANSEPILPFSWSTIDHLPYDNHRLIPTNTLPLYLESAVIGTTTDPFDWMHLNQGNPS